MKLVVDGVAAFVFSWAAVQHIEREPPAKLIACFELESRATFLCRGLKVETWRLDQIFDVPATAVAISPRKLVKDFVPGREVTDDLSPWLLLQAPAVTSNIYEAWCHQAARRVLGGLVNVASQEDGQVWLQANGPPMFRIAATNPTLETGLEELTKGAEWVYLTGHDLDARHLIVELARAYQPAMPFIEVVRQARESAATTYEAHVQSASRETLKALADLRKTIIDETQKITQRAQDLTSGLWRDVAVSTSPFALKILGDAAKLPNIGITAGFYFAAAIFIAVAFGLQVRINGAYLENQRQARAKWFETLYAIISPTERKTIAEDPIKKAEVAYKETRFFCWYNLRCVGRDSYRVRNRNALGATECFCDAINRTDERKISPSHTLANATTIASTEHSGTDDVESHTSVISHHEKSRKVELINYSL